MQLNRLSLLAISSLALTLAGCPEPTDKSGRDDNMGGSGGSGSGGSGGSGSGGSSSGGSGGSSSGGSGGSSAGSGGSGGSGSGGARMDASAGGSGGSGSGGARMDGPTGSGGTRMDGPTGGGSDSGGRGDMGGTPASLPGMPPLMLLSTKCGGCHGAMTFTSNMSANMWALAQAAAGRACANRQRASVLLGKVDGTTPACGNKMPAGGGVALTPAEVTMIKMWLGM